MSKVPSKKILVLARTQQEIRDFLRRTGIKAERIVRIMQHRDLLGWKDVDLWIIGSCHRSIPFMQNSDTLWYLKTHNINMIFDVASSTPPEIPESKIIKPEKKQIKIYKPN